MTVSQKNLGSRVSVLAWHSFMTLVKVGHARESSLKGSMTFSIETLFRVTNLHFYTDMLKHASVIFRNILRIGGLSENLQKQVFISVCTQPRRISAVGVAERVAAERVERIGNVVGYQIRLESKTSSSTRLLFCTTGDNLIKTIFPPSSSSLIL